MMAFVDNFLPIFLKTTMVLSILVTCLVLLYEVAKDKTARKFCILFFLAALTISLLVISGTELKEASKQADEEHELLLGINESLEPFQQVIGSRKKFNSLDPWTTQILVWKAKQVVEITTNQNIVSKIKYPNDSTKNKLAKKVMSYFNQK